ncbi:uncharacterized protein LOC133923047 [Phragmites australis]|uniref:uncharacterized protein LOC133923047 n=1 Tax=Phragmites australis TaxID=29695 RepID=UPI002D7879EB|nr:uncharacterized protein LOC133923047 [Phragmites australis]
MPSRASRSSSSARRSFSLTARAVATHASKRRLPTASLSLSTARAVRLASSCIISPATTASSRPITSRALPSTTGRGSAGRLGDGRALGPLRASSEGLEVPKNCHAGTAHDEVVRPTLDALGPGSASAGCSGATAATRSGLGGACGSVSTGALSSGALGSGARASLGTSGCPWSPGRP